MPRSKYKNHRNTRRNEYASGTLTKDVMAKTVEIEGETLTNWEYFLARIRVGSSLEQEAERLGIPSGSVKGYIWNKNHPERREEYNEARKVSAEIAEDELNHKARELLEDGYIDRNGEFQNWSRDMVAARDKGLFHLYQRLKYRDRDRYGDKTEQKVTHDLSDDLRRRLEAAHSANKERARIEHNPGPVIDAEWSEVKPEPQAEPQQAKRDSERD